jgi:hypothetical protein
MVVWFCEIPNEFSELSAIGSYLNQQRQIISKPQTLENERKNKGFSLHKPGVFTIGLRAPTIAVGEAIS